MACRVKPSPQNLLNYYCMLPFREHVNFTIKAFVSLQPHTGFPFGFTFVVLAEIWHNTEATDRL